MKMLKYYGLCLFIFYISNISAQIVINEVQFTNKTTLRDARGNTPDWIELYNAGEDAVDLKGFQLLDSKNVSDAFIFPSLVLKAKSYFIVYASGKDTVIDNEYHSAFKLRVLKDSLFLFNANLEQIDSVVAQCVPSDKSIGYFATNDRERKILSPSPGVSNQNSDTFTIHYQPDTLIVDRASGHYPNAFPLHLKNSYKQNTIYYTLNASEPDVESTVYAGSIYLHDISANKNRFANKVEEFEPGHFIAKANVVRAQVFSEGCPASVEVANTYFIDSVASFNYSVPVISIITEKKNLFDEETGIYVKGEQDNFTQKGSEWERPAHIEYFETSGKQVIDQEAGIRIHGRGTRFAPQKSFRLYAKEKYGKESFNYAFFDQKPTLDSFKTLVLRTSYGDWSNTLFKEGLCQHLVENMNLDYVAGQTAIAFVNGEYWGIYSLNERLDEHYIANNYALKSPMLDHISFDYGAVAKLGTIDNYDLLIAWLQHNNPKDQDFFAAIGEQIDLDNLVDYYVAELYLANTDFPFVNRDMWRFAAEGLKWRYMFFDLDGAMMKINYDHLSNYNTSGATLSHFRDEDLFILQRMLENDAFRKKFYTTFIYHLEHTFSSEKVLSLLNNFETLYAPLVTDHAYRWGKPIDYRKWNYNLNVLKDFALQRPAIMLQQLHKNFQNPFTINTNMQKGEINIDFGETTMQGAESWLFDVTGKLLLHQTLSERSTNVNSNNLSKGLYLLKIEIGTMVFTDKIIIN